MVQEAIIEGGAIHEQVCEKNSEEHFSLRRASLGLELNTRIHDDFFKFYQHENTSFVSSTDQEFKTARSCKVSTPYITVF